MRPRFTLWSDYGTSRKYRASAGLRGARSSLARKCLLAAAIVVAAAIASCELFGQAAEKMQDAAAGHAQSATVKRSAGIAPIPLSPQPLRPVEEAAVTASIAKSSIANSTPAHSATPASASDVPEGHAMPAITAVSGAMAKATTLPPSLAALAATKAAEKLRGVGGRRNVQIVHHLRDDDTRLIVRYVAARIGHSKELRAALRMFL
jgi:hypothetical protein